MKKFFKFPMAVAFAVAASLSFFACSSDDEPKAPEKEKAVEEATILTSFYVNQAMLDTYDIVGRSFLGQELAFSKTPVDIKLSDGESIPMYVMQLEGTSNAVPFISSMSVSFTLKEGYQVPEKSDFALAAIATGVITFDDGSKDNYSAQGYVMHNNGVIGDKIDGYTELLNKRFNRIKITLDTTGITIDTDTDTEE